MRCVGRRCRLVEQCEARSAFNHTAGQTSSGDGDFHLAGIVDHLRRINYTGHDSVELMNPQIWQVPRRQIGEIAMTALRNVLGLASMG